MYLFFNNKFYDSASPIILAESKAFRYGELVFETIRCLNGKILFWNLHIERLTEAAELLNITFPKYTTEEVLSLHIHSLLQKNNLKNARVRLTIFKGNGGLFENEENAFNILIETYELPNPEYVFNSNGLELCFFEAMLKTTDVYSNYKTGNHLMYNLAAQYAKAKKCNEAILCNVSNNICDGTIATIFVVKNNTIYTPPLKDGCIKGVVRTYLLQNVNSIVEKSITKDELLSADEVFVTNAVKGLQWVKAIGDKKYKCIISANLFNQYILPLNI